MNKGKLEKITVELLKAIGENPNREELKRTPSKFAKMLEAFLSGKDKNVKDVFQKARYMNHDEMILVRDIPFYSLCEHHLLPFFGKCNIAYVPDGKIVGISKFAEIVGILGKRLQVQERLTTDIADSIMEHLKPKGVGILIEARHLCMEMTGSRQPECKVVTLSMRGIFRKTDVQQEFLKLTK